MSDFEPQANNICMFDRSIELELEAGVVMMPHWNDHYDKELPGPARFVEHLEGLLRHPNPDVRNQTFCLLDEFDFPAELRDRVFCILDRYVWNNPHDQNRLYAVRRACSLAPLNRIPEMVRYLDLPEDLLAIPTRFLGYVLDENYAPLSVVLWVKDRIDRHLQKENTTGEERVIIWYCVTILYALQHEDRFLYYSLVVQKHGVIYQHGLDERIAEAARVPRR